MGWFWNAAVNTCDSPNGQWDAWGPPVNVADSCVQQAWYVEPFEP
jgi:hypothetical protein